MSRVLSERRDAVIERWAQCVIDNVSPAALLSREDLLNSIPRFVDALARAESRHVAEISTEHGRQRANISTYALEHVLEEYRFLRNILLEQLELGRLLTSSERTTVLDAIEEGMTQAAVVFSERLGFSRVRATQQAEFNTSLQQSKAETKAAVSEVSRLESERRQRELFVSMLTHDLRTPLTAAKLSLELLLQGGALSSTQLKLGYQAYSSIERTILMTRDLLDASRVTAGVGIPLNLEYGDLARLTRECVTELAARYGDRIELISPKSIEGRWDLSNLRRAITNLVDNAVKFGERDTPITVTLKQDHQVVLIAVRNQGEAIPQEKLRAIFSPYQHTRESGGGWGLGLTLVRGIAEAHGGDVKAESNEGGTTLTVLLPYAKNG